MQPGHRTAPRRAVPCRREDPPRIGGRIFRRARQIAQRLRAPIDRVKRVSPTRGLAEADRRCGAAYTIESVDIAY